VHAAATLLEGGHRVQMIDVGHAPPAPVLPDTPIADLVDALDDPVDYFLGRDFGSFVQPGLHKEYYGFPPSKKFVFERPEDFAVEARGFDPLFSFGQGGLAETWTAGCYPFDDEDLRDFPFGLEALQPGYDEVAGRIGVTGANDDLKRFFPWHEHMLEPLELDAHSRELLARYHNHRRVLNERYQWYMGRTRVAVLSKAHQDRRACQYLGRCLWGCPVDALYTPSLTLRQLREHPRFSYLSGLSAKHFRREEGGVTVVARDVESNDVRSISGDRLILAAGTLGSTEIFLRSAHRELGSAPTLTGLMDNRQILMPFLNLRMLGRAPELNTYQYHQVGFGMAGQSPGEYVHGQITSVTSASLHPIIQKMPLDLRGAVGVMKGIHAALGVVNANLSDTRRDANAVELVFSDAAPDGVLNIRYNPDPQEGSRVRWTVKRVRSCLRRLGCLVPPGMLHVRPMGASVHYAGTVPMTSTGAWTTTVDGESREFPGVFFADGSTFPALPAKNLTFTLMANAVRVAGAAAKP